MCPVELAPICPMIFWPLSVPSLTQTLRLMLGMLEFIPESPKGCATKGALKGKAQSVMLMLGSVLLGGRV